MKVLVTGGAGFIGSNLVYRLNQFGYMNITIVDRLGKTDKWRNLVGLQFKNYIDIDDFKLVSTGIKKPYDLVFHLGACSSTRETNASYLIKNNYEFTVNLAQFCLDNKIRFIYASSAATYGKDEAMSDSCDIETLTPLNPYGFSKQMFDLKAAREDWFDNIVGLKYFNVFGPNCEHKGVMKSFITRAYEEIKNTESLNMFDTYKNVPEGRDARDFLYIEDAIDMTLHFAFDPDGQTCNGLFNIGSGKATSWFDMAKYTFESMGKNTDIKYSSLPEELKEKYQYYTCANISKLRAAGYQNSILSMEEAVHRYVTKHLIPDRRMGGG